LEQRQRILLELDGCTVYYRKALALERVSMKVAQDELVSVIGANGAGKSTILKLIMGLVKPTEGRIKFDGEDITELPPYSIASKGISLCPEGSRIPPEMTVLESLELGAYLSRDKGGVKQKLDEVFDLFPFLRERKYQLGGTLSGGERQMLALARALMSEPKLLMFDEPSQGLAPVVRREIFQQIEKIKARNVCCILVEQEVTFSLKISKRCYVLANGRIVLSGTGKEMMENESFRHTYMGLT
jgi:branched-chain amino acid transport system ATP-binding protein